MIRITQLKLPITHTEQELIAKAAKLLRLPEDRILSWRIVKQSVDARKKPQIQYIYTVDVEVFGERQAVKRAKSSQVTIAEEKEYHFPGTKGKSERKSDSGQGQKTGRTPEERAKPQSERKPCGYPPVIVGSGPAGLFCGYMLAKAGYCPVILEQGEDVDSRRRKVEQFWLGGELDVRSNVQFGEGGAGTFSDGKLNTMVKDPMGRSQEVLRILAEHGADPSVLYVNKPHIGTDVLGNVVKNMRNHIIEMGGKVVFGAKVTELLIENGAVAGVRVACSAETAEVGLTGVDYTSDDRTDYKVDAGTNCRMDAGMGDRADDKADSGRQVQYVLKTGQVVLAIGHSARDTFSMLLEKGVPMQPKSFAVGLRIQHPQKMINESQYGFSESPILGPADYKLTHQTAGGRGIYSFCMCPGGYVVNASSEKGYLAVNGMSNHDRAGQNANSALIVTVTPTDFREDMIAAKEDFPPAKGDFAPEKKDFPPAGKNSPLAGVEFQRRLEKLAFTYGGGKIPVQLYGDFCANRSSGDWGEVGPEFKGTTKFANLRETLPAFISESIVEGVEAFEQKIRGFSRYDSILAGVESRTSSPVRIMRDEGFESEIKGLFPCGEGAGYAGGITSAAMDGMKVAEEIAQRYRPLI